MRFVGEKEMKDVDRDAIVDGLMSKSEAKLKKLTGSYFVGNIRIQISNYNQSTKERVAELYRKRRAQGLCILCGEKVTKNNKRTKKLYRLCDFHRKKIDHK